MPRLSKIGAACLAAFGYTQGTSTVTANYLVVAGGGGGGTTAGGGGGAGGLLVGITGLNFTQSYVVTVGGGGAGNANGANSVFATFATAIGGGRGATNSAVGGNGGSGGGGSRDRQSNGVTNWNNAGGTGTVGQGNNGGSPTLVTPPASSNHALGGGGGGAGAVGVDGGALAGGNGGVGLSSSISGTAIFYAGGGGGCGISTAGVGGNGGGGNGNLFSGSGTVTAGSVNTGGGGGGASGGQGSSLGGSGVVIISYTSPTQLFGGGIVTFVGGNWIHTFTTSGTLVPVSTFTASYLIVAGGGGGGGAVNDYTAGGGAGAGGLLSGTGMVIDTNSNYIVTVGAGAAGGLYNALSAIGGSSSLSIIPTTAIGGGAGAAIFSAAASSGGSGGGGGTMVSPTSFAGGSGTSGQGNAGGTGQLHVSGAGAKAGAGGGGAGAVGGSSSGSTAGAGGIGIASSISGTSTYYAGGGGGGSSAAGGAGGLGGGGAGVAYNNNGVSGTANTGGGGGGAARNNSAGSQTGGNGGSGIVIISYAGAQRMAGGTVTFVGGNTIHTFTSSGYLSALKLVNRSLRFKASTSSYLNRTWGTPTNAQKFTCSFWLKRGILGASYQLFGGGTAAANAGGLQFTTGDVLNYYWENGTNCNLTTTAVFRDPAAWYHIVIVQDTPQATAANRLQIYVNGVLQTLTGTYPGQNTTATFNSATVPFAFMAGRTTVFSLFTDGYATEFNWIDGQALTPTSFGGYNSFGVWQPTHYLGSYGSQGSYLPFTDNTSSTTIGFDFSPNQNNWTANGFTLTPTTSVLYDSMTDVPTLTSETASNWCIANPLDAATGLTINDGNLKLGASAGGSKFVRSSFALPANGAYYAEITFANASSASIGETIGICTASRSLTAANSAAGAYLFYASASGNLFSNGTSTATGLSIVSANELFQVAIDVTNSKMWIGRTNVWYNSTGGTTGNPSTGANPTFTGAFVDYFIYAGFDTASAVTANINFGQRPFVGTVPTGFVALNTFNM
jgi:hypothetical protein